MHTSNSAGQRLHELRAELMQRLARYHEHQIRAQQPLSADSSERAVERENDEVVDRLDEASTLRLQQVEAALRRIGTGSFGLCERCGASIEAARLEALPYAAECLACAQG